ncbi:hypothetical protein N320_00569, partial [Buceros rhinoceros silvestris]
EKENVLVGCEARNIAYVLVVHRFWQAPMAHCFYGDFI